MPSLSEAFRAHPIHLHHSHLDFGSAKEVPDTHAWPPLDEHLSGDKFDVESVPVIDLGDPNVVSHIGHACETWGVFHITNHGISKQLLSDVESQGRHLFSLPTQQKLKAARHPDGVAGYGLVRISSFFSKLMWSEGFTIVGSPLEHARQLWPCDHIQFCNVMEEYEKEMKKLSGRLMLLILESLGLKKEDVQWAGPAGKFEDTCAAIQLNWYPACPDPTRAMGLAEHTDSPLITILHQSSTSGLQVFRERGQRWITVAPLSGSLVVNVGDLLHILSNARFHSVLHRAVVNRTRQRLSVAYLWGPPAHIEISPSPQLLTPDRPRLYRAVSLAEYLSIKAKHFNNALAFIRLNPLVNRSINASDQDRFDVSC